MPMANPLINGTGGRTAPPPGGSPADTFDMGTYAMPAGTGPLRAEHNLPVHVAALVLLALGVIVLLQLAGFKFVVAGSVGVGK